MNEAKALSWGQFIETGFDRMQYSFIKQEGTFIATLDMKLWGKKPCSLTNFFTLEDGQKIIAYSWSNNDYLGITEIQIGSKVKLTFTKTRTGFFTLKECEKI